MSLFVTPGARPGRCRARARDSTGRRLNKYRLRPASVLAVPSGSSQSSGRYSCVPIERLGTRERRSPILAGQFIGIMRLQRQNGRSIGPKVSARQQRGVVVVRSVEAFFVTVSGLAPTVVRDGPFRLFFFSREEERVHVHVAHPKGEAKFWLTPQVTLASHTGLSAKQLQEAQAVVEAHIQEIRNAWHRHFGS